MHAHLKPIGLELDLFVYKRYISGSGQFGHFIGQIGQKNGQNQMAIQLAAGCCNALTDFKSNKNQYATEIILIGEKQHHSG